MVLLQEKAEENQEEKSLQQASEPGKFETR